MSISTFGVPRGDINKQYGVWKGGFGKDGQTVVMSCSICGKVSSLSDHKIAGDGSVTPSMICPGCGLHGFFHLNDWKGEESGKA